MKVTIKPIPAFGDPKGAVKLGRTPDISLIDVPHPYGVFRRGTLVASYRTRVTANRIANGFNQLGGPKARVEIVK